MDKNIKDLLTSVTVEAQTKLKDYEIPVFSDYKLDARKKISSDSDTDIYCGIKNNTEEKVVFKLKSIDSKDSNYILKEGNKYLKLKGIKRIPKLYSFGSQGKYMILGRELLGPSLKMLLE